MLDNDVFVVYLKAGSSVNPEELAEMARHGDPIIRMRVAENPRTSISTMLALVGDEDPEVRCALSENPGIPIFIMDLLAEDENDDVRFWVADNPHTPIFVLGKLLLDRNCYVAERAKRWFEATVQNFEVVKVDFKRQPASTQESYIQAG